MEPEKISLIKEKLKNLREKKSLWLDIYQLIDEFILNRKLDLQNNAGQPGFIIKEIFDNTAQKAAETASSAFLGALWPSGAQSFELMPARGLSDTEEIRDYFRFNTDELISIMDDARSGLSISLTEYMEDQVVFGISGVGVFESKGDIPVRYRAWNVKTMHVDEDENGFVDTIINEEEKTVRQLILEYGFKNVSEHVQRLYENKKFLDKIKIVTTIEPRREVDRSKFGNMSKPIASIHFEEKSGNILRESGFDEMPVFVSRLKKALGEVQGRSFAMAALPDIIELNVIWETLTTAAEKIVEPPQAILADGDLGTTTIDTSAGAINVFNISGRLGIAKPIIDIATVGDLKPLILLVEKLTESVSNHFYIDRLLDLNNETRMTLGEAQIRNELRGQSLGAIFARQKAELFNNLIDRTFKIAFRAGRLGVRSGSKEEFEMRSKGIEPVIIPDEVMERMDKGQQVFRIKYISPAERFIKAEEVRGNFAIVDMLNATVPVNQESVDVISIDNLIRRTVELTGASKEIINGLDTITKIREARNIQLQEQAEIEKAREKSETTRNIAQAVGTFQNTGGNGKAK